jgi:DNA-binding MarR family transcriptional regulator
MNQSEHAELSDLPPSALLVYRVLKEDQPRTKQEIMDASYLHRNTCRKALDRLDDAGLLTQRPKPDDGRQMLFSLKG